MKKLLSVGIYAFLMVAFVAPAFGSSIPLNSVTFVSGEEPSSSPALASATIWNFDSIAPTTDLTTLSGPSPFQSVSGHGEIVQGDVANVNTTPWGESTSNSYLEVAYLGSGVLPSDVTIDLSSLENYFGLYWGTIDSFNSVTFNNTISGDTLTYTGDKLLLLSGGGGNLDGDQATNPLDNGYVNFFFGGMFNQVVLSTADYNFEVNKLAVGNSDPVPEPTTMVLMGMGLFGIVGLKKRKKNI
jgi:hypothetical protein